MFGFQGLKAFGFRVGVAGGRGGDRRAWGFGGLGGWMLQGRGDFADLRSLRALIRIFSGSGVIWIRICSVGW